MNRTVISTLLTLALFWLAPFSANLQQDHGKPAATSAAIFAVLRSPDNNVAIEPVVIIERGRFVKPPEGVDKDANGKFSDTLASARFAAKYYRTGHQYHLLFGAGKAGIATVTRRTSLACISLSAAVRLETSAKIGGAVEALATDSDSLGSPEGSRRAASAAEREAAVGLARRAYRQKGVSASLIQKMTVFNLTAADLNHDGNTELIGSFRIDDPEGAYVLFLIMERNAGANFGVALQRYDKGNELGEDLVDYLDLDGDGIDEVITRIAGYESYEYAIYKKKDKKWRAVYQGGGNGC